MMARLNRKSKNVRIIQNYLDDLAEINPEALSISLMDKNGLGILLFLCYAQKNGFSTSNDELINAIVNQFEKKINSEIQDVSFYSGLCGFAWLLNHLEKNGFISLNSKDFFNVLDNIIEKFAANSLKSNNHDFLHGAMGASIYLLSCPNRNNELILNLHSGIMEKAIVSEEGMFWKYFLDDGSDSIAVELGLAHGIVGKLVYLSKIYANYPENKESIISIKRIVEFLKRKKNNPTVESIYPSLILKDATVYPNLDSLWSRMAWCTGDLSIGIGLYQTGQMINDESLKNEGIEIFLRSTKRKTHYQTGIVDSGICHGTSGIALMYNRMYKNTGLFELKECALYWTDKSAELFEKETQLINSSKIRSMKSIDQSNNGILSGYTGVALTIMSVYSTEEYDWDGCLLLN